MNERHVESGRVNAVGQVNAAASFHEGESPSFLDLVLEETTEQRKHDDRYAPRDGRPFAEGSYALVYRADDSNLERTVAIKVMKNGFLDCPQTAEALKRRFRREALILASLRHTNVLFVQDADTLPDGRPYIVSDYLRGRSVAEELETHGPFALDRAVSLFSQLCSAIQAAHEEGIIHRDIKPENMVLTQRRGQEHLVVLDFGEAKRVGDTHLEITRGKLVGTPLYFSPEQCAGEDASRLSDVYSLAVTLFELVTGRPPYAGNSLQEMISLHLKADIPDPRAYRSDLPPDAAKVIRIGLSKRPDERYSSAESFAQAFQRSINGESNVRRVHPRRFSRLFSWLKGRNGN